MAIVAESESYPQWNDEVKAVYALARYDDGRPSQRRVHTVIQGRKCAKNRGGFIFRYRLRQSRVGAAMTMDPLRRWCLVR